MEIFDPRRPEIMADPYPALAELRARNPVYWSPVLRGWLVTRYRDVRTALFDPRLSADRITPFLDSLPEARRLALSGLERILTRWAVFTDPPAHTRLRGLMNRAFTPSAVAGMRGAIETIARELADAMAGRGQLELIGDFAYPLPARVIAGLLGVPAADIDRFREWSDNLAVFVGSAQAAPYKYDRAAYGLAEMDAYFRAIVRERRGQPARSDLIGALIAAEEDGRALDEDELVATSVLVLFAGHETTTNLIGNGLLALLRHPGELARLRANADLLESAVEEMLRYDAPAACVTRIASAPLELAGRRIARGQRLFLMINSANRDVEQFTDPDRLDIGRIENRHLAFGHGPHFCIGAPLARLEAQVAFRVLLSRFEELALTGEPLEWSDNLVLRGVKSLKLVARAA
jgi:cytochrome P450